MNEIEFQSTLRSSGLFLTLSFTSLIYYHGKKAKGINYLILLLSFLFNLISISVTFQLFKKTKKLIPKYLIICNLIILYHHMRLLFKH